MLLVELIELIEKEATDKKQAQWRKAQEKYHKKKKRSGKKEIRTFVSKSTRDKLKNAVTDDKEDMGSAIDKELQ